MTRVDGLLGSRLPVFADGTRKQSNWTVPATIMLEDRNPARPPSRRRLILVCRI
jgi:hypothetical protein